MRLADTFQAIVDSLPSDWTDLDLDLRIRDEDRYIEAAVIVAQCNGQPYSRSDWHWRLLVAQQASLHGGEIEVGDSALGGARFTVRLPLDG